MVNNNILEKMINEGKIEIEGNVYNVSKLSNTVYLVTTDDYQLGLMDLKCNKLRTLDGISLITVSPDFGLATIVENGLYGLMDFESPEILIPCEYNFVDMINEGFSLVGKFDKNKQMKYGFVDCQYGKNIAVKYTDARSFSEGLAAVCKKNKQKEEKWGFVNVLRHEQIPVVFDYAESFSCGYAVVGLKDENGIMKYGYIDHNGIIVVKPMYAKAEPYYGLFLVTDKNGLQLAFDENYFYYNIEEYYKQKNVITSNMVSKLRR